MTYEEQQKRDKENQLKAIGYLDVLSKVTTIDQFLAVIRAAAAWGRDELQKDLDK